MFAKAESLSLVDYLARAKNLYDRDRSLQARFPTGAGADFDRFIDTDAVLYYREIQEVAVPVPPWREMLTVGGETDLRIFLEIGYDCYVLIKRCLSRFGDGSISKILDFGVGCARTARFFFRDPDLVVHGCDIDRNAIRFIDGNIPFIRTSPSASLPPLDYASGTFDLAYGISLFTHFNKQTFVAWLGEMHRVLRPGGLLLISLHCQTAFAQVEANAIQRRMIGIEDDEFAAAKGEFSGKGFLWLKQPVGSADIDTSSFGISFITHSHLNELATGRFSSLSITPGEISGWQDVVILKRLQD